ncbi:MAG TPA: hypothetical protein DEH10_12355 [Pseudomonas sp.]|uniref:hypothetical protein n=1 Tax=uncultured Pseudomonas sp. TaxID=114707 RepID=UPI000E94AC15|nr:hypothetical protein [Pseudomonas sp. UBA2684]HBX56162.1 hypothetical protein [Pseudomonas sp.]|tara:strand:+ start:1842 stop:2075 length:234 start_codon:yes stop_codon:yes gene_type:complete
MFCLRSLLAARRPMRLFALLGDDDRCRAFRQSTQAPVGVGWIEVNEQRLCWLQQTLPASAKVAPVVVHAGTEKALAA